MSNREKAINIIESFSDSQMGYIVSMLQNFQNAIEEAADDAFCERLYNDYLNDSDPDKNDGVTIENLAESMGIRL